MNAAEFRGRVLSEISERAVFLQPSLSFSNADRMDSHPDLK